MFCVQVRLTVGYSVFLNMCNCYFIYGNIPIIPVVCCALRALRPLSINSEEFPREIKWISYGVTLLAGLLQSLYSLFSTESSAAYHHPIIYLYKGFSPS